MLEGKNAWFIFAIAGIIISCLVLNPVYYQARTQSAAAQEQKNQAAVLAPLIGVLEFTDDVYRNNHYGSYYFSNYFHRGDTVTFQGFITRVGDWYAPLGAVAQVTIESPDGSLALSRNITTDFNNKFEVALPLSSSALVGRYIAQVEPIKEGARIAENQYITQFFVLRNTSLELTVPSIIDEPLQVSLGSLEYDLKDASYESSNKTLRHIVEKAPTNSTTSQIYFNDTSLDYPYFSSELMVDKRLRDGPNRIWVNGVPVGSGLLGNDKYAQIQLFVADLNQFSGPITIIISGYENNY